MTDAFDTKNDGHQKCKKGIEIGNGLPDIRTCRQVAEALKAAGFEVRSPQPQSGARGRGCANEDV